MDTDGLRTGNILPGYLVLDNRLKLHETSLSAPGKEDKASEKQRLLKAATEFESFFIYYLLQRMRATVPKGGLFGEGRQQEIYTSMMDEELAKQLAAGGGIGLSRMLVDQLARSLNKE